MKQYFNGFYLLSNIDCLNICNKSWWTPGQFTVPCCHQKNRGTEPSQVAAIITDLKIDWIFKDAFLKKYTFKIKYSCCCWAHGKILCLKKPFIKTWQIQMIVTWVGRSVLVFFFNWEQMKVCNRMRAKIWAVFKQTDLLTACGYSLCFMFRNVSTVYGLCW